LPFESRASFKRLFPVVWLVAFFGLAFAGTSMTPPSTAALCTVTAAGWVFVLLALREEALQIWQQQRALLIATGLLELAIAVSEAASAYRGLAPPHPLLPQSLLLACWPVLAIFLADANRMRAVVTVFCAVCAWHFFAMPIEAITGTKLSWHPVALLPRAAGPLNYQASGLAFQSYFFPGLFLPLFYLAWGPIYEGRVFPGLATRSAAMLALPLIWLIPVACVQSRSAFAGTLAAALLAIIAAHPPRRWRAWLAAGLLVASAALVYWVLFAQNKSGANLRLAYLELYLREALDGHWILTGHGAYRDPGPPLTVPGTTPLEHSHNDFVQVLYSFGLPGLAAYLTFLAALVCLVRRNFTAKGEYWPACALVALLPNMMTDLGIHHYEKAAFLVTFAAFCVAWSNLPSAKLKP